MGIPHLLGHLQPYAVDVPLSDTSVVVDGPSLAYHIWHLCSRSQDAQPSHGILVKTCVAWLEALQRHGADIKAIYFDGFLPSSKRPVRLDRLHSMSMKLQNLQRANSASCPVKYVAELDSNTQVDFRKASDRRREPAHTPAFLVPAVIEGLRATAAFERLVRLVPGEADVYCAQHVVDEGGCVITTDSDLLVHDLGSGSVIMFWSIEILSLSLEQAAGSAQPLSTLRFTPADIAERLKIDPSHGGMRRFGYELSQNSNASISKIIETCHRPVNKPRAYAEFIEPYAPLPRDVMREAIDFSSSHGRHLDPRFSELIMQSSGYTERFLPTTFREERSRKHPGSPEAPLISLPLLLDCPTRASAWQETEHIRQAAYTILHAAYPSNWPFVREFRRVQSLSSKGTKVEFIDQDVEGVASYIVNALDRTVESAPDLSEFVPTCQLHMDQQYSEKGHDGSLLLDSLRPFLAARKPLGAPTDWSVVHVTAQLQAMYYSWRLLSQVVSVVLPTYPPDSIHAKILGKVQVHLRRLPLLTEYPTPFSAVEMLHRLRKYNLVPATLSAPPRDPDSVVPASFVAASPEKNKKKRKSKVKPSAGEPVAKNPRVSTNPFDILGEE